MSHLIYFLYIFFSWQEEEDFFEHISMEGYMEKLPINKKKATLLKTWKRRFFKAQEGHLYYYEVSTILRTASVQLFPVTLLPNN